MLRSLKSLEGFTIAAADGELGRVEQFFFDDARWTVRYLVVNTGSWLRGRLVLVSPISVRGIDTANSRIEVALTRAQVERSPDIDAQKPVSRQKEIEYFNHYGWPYYWAGTGIWGVAPFPMAMIARPYPVGGPPPLAGGDESLRDDEASRGDPHLRSTREVNGYRIHARDARFGHVEDFVVDERSWEIRYLVADTVNWLPSPSVLLAPAWVERVSWEDRELQVDLTHDQVRRAPEFRPTEPIHREYERMLYDYYGRPAYWEMHDPTTRDALRDGSRHVI
jgi:hypothetical protein